MIFADIVSSGKVKVVKFLEVELHATPVNDGRNLPVVL